MRDYFAELWGEAAIRFRITAENLADSDKSANLADDEKRLGSTTHE